MLRQVLDREDERHHADDRRDEAGLQAYLTHPLHRDPADRSRWTEWGFLDYGALDPRITSINAPVEALEGAAPFDAACSVSVVEHLPADVRRAALARIAALLRPGGYWS